MTEQHNQKEEKDDNKEDTSDAEHQVDGDDKQARHEQESRISIEDLTTPEEEDTAQVSHLLVILVKERVP